MEHQIEIKVKEKAQLAYKKNLQLTHALFGRTNRFYAFLLTRGDIARLKQKYA